MRVVIRQADLDTCVTAFVLGVRPGDEVCAVAGMASRRDLVDSCVICIEVGGSGDVNRRNFDHHAPGGPAQSACRQALALTGRPDDPWFERLVYYAESIDLGIPVRYTIQPGPGLVTLSALISGIRLVEPAAVAQLRRALRVLETFAAERLDPFESVPVRSEWKELVDAKQGAAIALADACTERNTFTAASGLNVGCLVATVPGAVGALYLSGCDVAIAYNPEMRKFTIGGRERQVCHLKPYLDALEQGWGGPARGTILASRFGGSRLTVDQVLKVVAEHC